MEQEFPTTNPEKMHEMLQLLQKEWPETMEMLNEAEIEAHSGDLFAEIEYLTFCDQLCKAIYVNLKEVNFYIEELKKKGSKHNELLAEYQELKQAMQVKMKNIGEEYQVAAEDTLRKAQDLIAKFAEEIPQDKISPTLPTDITQNLEKDLYLAELKDSLELYRQEREDFILEVSQDAKLIKDELGEKIAEIDPIISQLDTAITECDAAILSRDISE